MQEGRLLLVSFFTSSGVSFLRFRARGEQDDDKEDVGMLVVADVKWLLVVVGEHSCDMVPER